MLDINLFRNDLSIIKNNLKKRNMLELVPFAEEVSEKDRLWREKTKELDNLRHEKNLVSKQIADFKKENKNSDELFEKAKQITERRKDIELDVSALRTEIDSLLLKFPNLLDSEVHTGKTAEDNQVMHEWGKPVSREIPHHMEIAESFNLADFKRAVKISGAGFYFYKGDLVFLSLALQRFALDILSSRGYIPLIPPFMLRKEYYQKVVSLDDFENVMYPVSEDSFLIGTSEHPLVAMHSDEIFSIQELPIKYAGLSQCFRKEVGKHGLDESGFFRVHQFDKVEQVVFCKPSDSSVFLREMLFNSEELLQKLEIPYRVIKLCSSDTGFTSSITYDIEGYSPRENTYIELMSASNVKDFQARRANIKYRSGEEKEYVHTLNNTMVSITRFFRVFFENKFDGEKIVIPKSLVPYFGKSEIFPK